MVNEHPPKNKRAKKASQEKHRKQKSIQAEPNISNKSNTSEPISQEAFERLKQAVHLETIETHGFDKASWLALSYDDKCLLPLYISMEHRKSSTAAEKNIHIKQKRNISSIVFRYKKYAMQKFYMKHKKDVKKLKDESKVSTSQAITMLWDRFDNAAKNQWYETYSDVPEIKGSKEK